MAMDVEPFYYLRVEDVVPEDAVYVVIGGSITEVPEDVFEDHENLARVEFQEGVEEIGRLAFADCPNLAHVDGASSLRTIGIDAFADCKRLSGVDLREGLRRIGDRAFLRCALERIAVPSSVEMIGESAFAHCERLSEAILREGLRRIGKHAFGGCGFERIAVPSSVEEIGNLAFLNCETLSHVILREGLQQIGEHAFCGCALRRITIPSSVVDIGEGAFYSCKDLEAVTLAGGRVLVEGGAFHDCPRLKCIEIPSMAIIVKKGGDDGNALTAVVTGGIERDPANESFEPPQLILPSPHLVSMRPEDLTNLIEAINQCVDTTRGAGPLILNRDVSVRIRDCFNNSLSTWYEWYKNEVAATLELGLWKIELGKLRRFILNPPTPIPCNCPTGGGKRARVDVPTRDDSRSTCGADPIVGLVLSALAGPHRRVDQAGNERPIRP